MDLLCHEGSCHCGAVCFQVFAPSRIKVLECNCSICSKTGYIHLIVPTSKFKIIDGLDLLTTYTFNTGIAQHTFCKICGVKPFYVPRSHPDCYSVNLRCIDSSFFDNIKIEKFDGLHWEENIEKIKDLT